MELVTVKTFFHKHDAEMALGLLKNNGIDTMLSADDSGGYRPHLTIGMGNYRLLVKPDDVERAKTILKDFDQPLSDEELKNAETKAAEEKIQPAYTGKKRILTTVAISLVAIPLLAAVGFGIGAKFFPQDKRDCRLFPGGAECRQYYNDKKLKILERYSGLKGENSTFVEYYHNGVVRYEYSYVNKKLEGPRKGYYESGKLEFEDTYQNNVLEGEGRSYYETGEISEIYHFKNNELDGAYKVYSKKGEVLDQLNYQAGILLDSAGKPYNGMRKIYIENNSLWSEENYKQGKLDGISKYYTENGILKNQAEYSKGGQDSIIETYSPNGKIQRVDVYKNNYHFSSKEYDPQGNLIYKY